MLIMLSFSVTALDTNYSTYGLNYINGFMNVGSTTYAFTDNYTIDQRLAKYSEYTPVVGDLDQDGSQEIVIVSRADQTIYLYGNDGIIKAQLATNHNITSDPVLFDFNRNGNIGLIYSFVNVSVNGIVAFLYNATMTLELIYTSPSFGTPAYDIKVGAWQSNATNTTSRVVSYASIAGNTNMRIYAWNGTGLFLDQILLTGLPTTTTHTRPIISRLYEPVGASKGEGTDFNFDGVNDFCAIHFPDQIVCADDNGVIWGNFTTAPYVDNIDGLSVVNSDGGSWEFVVTGIDQAGVEAEPTMVKFDSNGNFVKDIDVKNCGTGASTCNVADSTAPLVFIPASLSGSHACFGWVSNDNGAGDTTADLGLTCVFVDTWQRSFEANFTDLYTLPKFQGVSNNLIGWISWIDEGLEISVAMPELGIFNIFGDSDFNESGSTIYGDNILRADIDNDGSIEIIATNGTETLIYTQQYINQPPQLLEYNWSTGQPICLGSTQTYSLSDWFDSEQNIIKLTALCSDGTNDSTGFVSYSSTSISVDCLKNATGSYTDFLYLEDFFNQGTFENVSPFGFTQIGGGCFNSNQGGGGSADDLGGTDPEGYDCFAGWCVQEAGNGNYISQFDSFDGNESSYFDFQRCDAEGYERNYWCIVKVFWKDSSSWLLWALVGGGSLIFLAVFVWLMAIKILNHGNQGNSGGG